MDLKQFSFKKILVVNTFGIGDVLFTTPFISNLKAHFPTATIDFVCNRRTMPLLANYSKINKVFVYERDEFKAVVDRSKWEFYKKAKDFLMDIKKEQYDVVFDFSLNSVINYCTWFVGIKQRIGFNYKNRSPLLTFSETLKGFEDKHVVEYYLDLLEKLQMNIINRQMELTVTADDKRWADQFLAAHEVNGKRPLCGVFPGAGASWGKSAGYRRWSSEKYAKLVDKLIEKFSVQIILMGDQSEEELCSRIIEGSSGKAISAVGKTSIGQLAALISRCDGIVLNDGGPLHLAVAVGTKTVSIFGPVDENVYGPFNPGDKHFVVTQDIFCRPCYRRFRMTKCDHVSCLKGIEVEDVIGQARKIFN